ncbi:hypothetical protein CRV15_01635 [Streptomyces clavuligerus]|nr:hypothetical protein D1794_01635 [Streptomyces clavuligerus]QCS04411.1 hypothetical protein CRV15_01635 [Streptomyces clavuligerus]
MTARFHKELPASIRPHRAAPADTARTTGSSQPPRGDVRGARVLVVEDEPSIAGVLSNRPALPRVDVSTAATVCQARHLAERSARTPCCST